MALAVNESNRFPKGRQLMFVVVEDHILKSHIT